MKKWMKIELLRKHPCAMAACGWMAAAAIIRLVYFLSAPVTPYIAFVHLLLPVSAAVLFLWGIIKGGRAFPWLSTASVALGIAFFVTKAFVEFTPLHRNLCTLLYITVLTVYTATVYGCLPTKKLLFPLFGLPLLYHIFVEDTQYYFFADPPVPVWEWLPEISVLCIMTALFCQSFAIKAEKIQ